MSRRLLICLLLLSASAAGTAQVYKVVGQDGKVNFTDRPPSATGGSVHLVRSGVAYPVLSAKAAGPEADAKASGAGPASDGTAGAQPSGPTVQEKARMQGALRIVLDRVALIEGATIMCSDFQPASITRYVAAHDGWKKRNEQILANGQKALATVFAADRAQLEKYAKATADMALQPVRARDQERRVAWCDQNVEEINSKGLDLKDVAWVKALM